MLVGRKFLLTPTLIEEFVELFHDERILISLHHIRIDVGVHWSCIGSVAHSRWVHIPMHWRIVVMNVRVFSSVMIHVGSRSYEENLITLLPRTYLFISICKISFVTIF